jgi:hypothetical protein
VVVKPIFVLLGYRDVCHAKGISLKVFWNTSRNISISSSDEDERNIYDIIIFVLIVLHLIETELLY